MEVIYCHPLLRHPHPPGWTAALGFQGGALFRCQVGAPARVHH